jgi:peptidoglycan/LPS O-acetylase OafA/YrhL
MEADKPARRMIFVDGLRGIAAMTIVFAHTADIFHETTQSGSQLGQFIFMSRFYAIESVQVFFVLSGFVIAYTLREARLTPPAFGRFFLRRAIRLDPPYWVSICLSLSVLALLAKPGHRVEALPSCRVIFSHLFYLQDLLGYGEPINHIFWTLSVEIQMYLVFGLAICILRAMRLPYRPLLVAGFILTLGWPLGWFHGTMRRSFVGQEYCFMAGAVAWWAVERSVPRWMLLAAFGSFLAISVSRVGDYHTWTTLITAMLLVAAGRLETLYTWLGSRPFQFLGAISYGLYLVHDPIIQLIVPFQRLLGLTSTVETFGVLVLVYPCCFIAAYSIRRFVEVPSIRLSHRLKPPTVQAA